MAMIRRALDEAAELRCAYDLLLQQFERGRQADERIDHDDVPDDEPRPAANAQ
ncbi:MAG: hypothetical protein ABJB97_08150 [Acidobacteriota bacterium]